MHSEAKKSGCHNLDQVPELERIQYVAYINEVVQFIAMFILSTGITNNTYANKFMHSEAKKNGCHNLEQVAELERIRYVV